MKSRYRLIRRGLRSGAFYCVDTETGKRTSLQTSDETSAREIVRAKNQAELQPALNLQLAKAYLAGTDSGVTTRTWSDAFGALIPTKQKENRERWERALRDAAFDVIRRRVIVETTAEHLLNVLRAGTVSTNVFLRRIHNFCVDMNWLPWPILPKRQWPAVRFAEKRGITLEEHRQIVDREKNPERKAFYELAWHLGASQSDLANLQAEDVDRQACIISFYRQKTKWRGGPPRLQSFHATATTGKGRFRQMGSHDEARRRRRLLPHEWGGRDARVLRSGFRRFP